MPAKFVARKIKRFFIYRVLSLDDTPHRIALGLAVGMFITFTPTIPFQMVLTILISALLGANKFVGVPFVWISNPLTMGPIFYLNFLVGSSMLGGKYSAAEAWNSLVNAVKFGAGWVEKAQLWWQATWKIFLPLWSGSFVVAVIVGVLSYIATYWGVVAWRRRRKHHEAEIARKAQAKAAAAGKASDENADTPANKPTGGN